jgi:soluble lytic murein transglycosylase-like protein
VAGQNPSPAKPATEPDAITEQQRSIAIQQRSIERQRAAAGPLSSTVPRSRIFSPPDQADSAFAAFPPDCPPVSPMVLQGAIQSAAAANNVSPALISAVISQESGGYPCAVSEKGAMGLMQLMPATAVQMGLNEPFDVSRNVAAGTRLLAELMERYKGDLNRVLGAYNAGPAAVDRSAGTPPFPETVNYIHSILEQIKQPFDPKLFSPAIR